MRWTLEDHEIFAKLEVDVNPDQEYQMHQAYFWLGLAQASLAELFLALARGLRSIDKHKLPSNKTHQHQNHHFSNACPHIKNGVTHGDSSAGGSSAGGSCKMATCAC